MSQPTFAPLPNRQVLRIGGPERHSFLQGLVTNDIEKLSPERALYAALLSPQGKILADFMLIQRDEEILLDCDADTAPNLLKRLTMYKLRAEVSIDTAPDLQVAAIFGAGAAELAGAEASPGKTVRKADTLLVVDPRYAALGVRLVGTDALSLAKELTPHETSPGAYQAHRHQLGIAEGPEELGVEQMFALEANLAELNGVDFQKGCYVGQELTARMKHKTTLRKRIVPLDAQETLPTAPVPLTAGDRDIGTMCANSDLRGLAVLRLDRLEEARAANKSLFADGIEVTPTNPPWLSVL